MSSRGAGRPCGRVHLRQVERQFREGSVIRATEAYVRRCRAKGADKERGYVRFPNLAGMARVLGIGLDELKRLGEKYPVVYDAMLAVLEDGALETALAQGKAALLTMNYFRRRLGYEVQRPPAKTPLENEASGEDGGVTVIFEHNMAEDGQ